MSLINDALKKAQKQRTGDTPPLASMPSIGGEPAARIASRGKSDGAHALMRAGLIGGGVLALLVGGYFVLRSANRAPTVVGVALPADAKQSAGQTPGSQQGTTVPAPATGVALPADAKQSAGQTPASPQGTTVSTPAVTFNLPVALPGDRPGQTSGSQQGTTVPAPATGVALPADAKQSAGQTPGSPQGTTVSTPVVAKPAPAGKFDGKAITFIETLRIAGIRASATDSKVLMNDRVYRIGDIVEHEMGLKLIGITSSSLTFENEAGARYTRNF